MDKDRRKAFASTGSSLHPLSQGANGSGTGWRSSEEGAFRMLPWWWGGTWVPVAKTSQAEKDESVSARARH